MHTGEMFYTFTYVFLSLKSPCPINSICLCPPSVSASFLCSVLASLQFLTLKTSRQTYPFLFIPPPLLPHLSLPLLLHSFPPIPLCFFTSILDPSVFPSVGLCTSWGSLSLSLLVSKPFPAVLWLLSSHYVLTYAHTRMQTNVHMHTHTHTCFHTCMESLFFLAGVFLAPAHAECVISSAWCPPLEK